MGHFFDVLAVILFEMLNVDVIVVACVFLLQLYGPETF